MGLESGDEEVLRRVKKGATAAEMIEAVRKAQAIGPSTGSGRGPSTGSGRGPSTALRPFDRVYPEQSRRAQGRLRSRHGFKMSVIGILGLGERERSREHAIATGQAVSAMDPAYFSLLTLMVVPSTELHRQWRAGQFVLIEPLEMLEEMRVMQLVLLAPGDRGKYAHPIAVGQDVVKAPGYAVDENGLDLAGRDAQLVFEKLLHGRSCR